MILFFLKILGGILAFCSLAIITFFLLCLIPEADHAKKTRP